jgi:nucleotide-binding universal stress UspA family protein
MRIKTILFPVDFSDRGVAILPHVEAAARRFGASVTMLHVVEPLVMPYGPIETLAFRGLLPPKLVAKAKKMIERVGDSAFDGVNVKRVVETGDPASCIADLARDCSIDLIMMPTRGRGVFRAALVGSVTAKVLNDVDCPVWTAAHVETLAAGRHVEWRNLVCTVDLSSETRHLIQTAQDLEGTCAATVRIVHAVPGREGASQEAARFIHDIQSQEGTDFEVSIEPGKVSRVVGCCVRRHNADLVLAGRGFDGGETRPRSHTYAIVRDAGCPVLTV